MEKKADVLFEASWEVCNKVGGIHTVISSKSAQISKFYNNFYLIGPYFLNNLLGQFVEDDVPAEFRYVIDNLKNEGIGIHFGRWLINSSPYTFLIDYKGAMPRLNEFKTQMWDRYKVDSLMARWDFDEPVIWSYCVGRLIKELATGPLKGKKCVGQFHEWLCGAAILYLKMNNIKVGTVFTTHATILGRTLAGSGYDLYNSFDDIDPDKKAIEYNIQEKHSMEKQSAINADVFTTVSEITGIEAGHLLGRRPDLILPNGLDIDKFPTFEDASIQHRDHKQNIKEYVMAHFFPYYSFDVQKSLIFFLSGRYEFHTKGIDIFIDSLGKLNLFMKKVNHENNVIAFIFVPGDIRNIKPEIIEAKSLFNDVKEYLVNVMPDVQNQMMYSFLSDTPISKETLFSKDFIEENRRRLLRFKKKGMPPLCTHDLNNEQYDQILNALKSKGLLNRKEDKVKVIFYPLYLNGADGLLNSDYYETILGSHLGVFPSYYEPWGYTPLEAGALGISAITTDLSGFGMYVKNEVNALDNPGIFVIDRLNKNDEFVAESMADLFKRYIDLTKRERIDNKINARKIASMADWKTLILEYIKAHNLAISKLN